MFRFALSIAGGIADTGCMMRLRWPAAALLAWIAFPTCALAWGREGHQIISKIATRWIHPATAREAAALLEEGETLVTISTWADEVRAEREETATWHYINLPLEAKLRGIEWRAYCPPAGCILSAIEDSLKVLRDRSAGRVKLAEALKFLVHFVGDLHQPLHTVDRNDRGGNDLQVILNGQVVSLHWAWDTLLIGERQDGGFDSRERRRLGKG
ncbi:MAG: S1/P1 nuclease, partial [Bryobacter sp.]|nr:S1/P1 nuclease [Bryobacter sp.]